MADFSPTRTHATWKPRVTAAHVPFFRCQTCGHVFAALDHGGEITLRNDGERSLINEPPYSNAEFHPECCGEPMELLKPIPHEEVEDKIKLNYQIVGGMNSNGLNVTWSVKDPACKPRWFSLKTFTGIMTKYVMPKKWPPIVFGFADEDAFAYCDKNPCVECTFRCKRGMEIYAYVENLGLVVMPLDRMVPPGSGNTSFDEIKIPGLQ